MPETDYLKIPQNRVGALIGSNGEVKKSIEKVTGTILDVDSEDGTVYISPREDMEDPLGVWNANHIVKAIARGFNPEVALKLVNDEIYLEIIKAFSNLSIKNILFDLPLPYIFFLFFSDKPTPSNFLINF